MTALALILALLTAVLGTVSVLLALEARRLSARLQAFMDSSEKAMASVVQDAREARLRWERLSDQVEAAAAPIARVGALADRVSGDLEAARIQYRDGLLSALQLAGWATGAYRLVQDLLAEHRAAQHRTAPPPDPVPAGVSPPEPALTGAVAAPPSQGDLP